MRRYVVTGATGVRGAGGRAANKVDLLPHLDFDMATFYANLRAVNPGVNVIETSARTGQGVGEWCSWLTTTHGNRLRENAAPA